MQTLASFLREVRRRNILGTLGIFVGAGWAVLQVLDLFIERGLLPEWTFTGALLALVLGLPVVLSTAFIQGGRRLAASGEAELSDTETDLARLLTWHRAILGGVLAFALLGVITVGFMVMRVTGIGAPGTLAAQGAFEVGGQVVIADFESSAGEAAPGDLITEALRIDLEQSVAFDLVDKAEVVETQRLMLFDPTDPLTESAAREVAQRRGVAGVISGEIGRVGSSFVLTSRLIEAESGTVLAPFRQTARDSTELVDAIDALAAQMRGKVGESLRSVAATESLRDVTTFSLEALKKFTYVNSRVYRGAIDAATARQLLEEAVVLDSTFATAYLSLAIAINNWGGSPERGWNATAAAYRHRDRLSERERYQVEAYYFKAAGDDAAAMQAYRRILQMDPTNTAAATNLADISMYSGDYDGAVDILRRTPNRGNTAWSWNLMTSLAGQGRLDEALAVGDTLEVDIPGTLDNIWASALLLVTSGELDDAQEVLASAPSPPPDYMSWAAMVGSTADALGGRVASSREKLSGSVAAAGRYGTVPDQILFGLRGPWVTAWVERDSAGVARDADALLASIDYSSARPRDRRYPSQAMLYAVVGDRARMDDVLERYSEGVDPESDPVGRVRADVARALFAARSGDDSAVAQLEAAVGHMNCNRCGDVLLGHGYETARRPAQAIEAYERYLAHPFFDGTEVLTHLFASNVHERLGMLYDELGDAEQAATHYRHFAELWKDPDPEYRDRVARAVARADALSPG